MSTLKDRKSYRRWAQACLSNNNRWRSLGDWLYPTKDNGTFSDVLIHYCYAYYKAYAESAGPIQIMEDERCPYCEKQIPYGVKMAALFEKL